MRLPQVKEKSVIGVLVYCLFAFVHLSTLSPSYSAIEFAEYFIDNIIKLHEFP